RRRRRDLAVAAALGMTRRQILTAVIVQSLVITTVALIVGVPLGVAAGRTSWTQFASELGVVTQFSAPIVPTVLVVLAVVAGAVLMALCPGEVAARRRPGPALRAE